MPRRGTPASCAGAGPASNSVAHATPPSPTHSALCSLLHQYCSLPLKHSIGTAPEGTSSHRGCNYEWCPPCGCPAAFGGVQSHCLRHLHVLQLGVCITRRLQRLYLVGASPGPPRPLLAHWPRWQDTPWGDGPKPEMLGHLRLPHPASAHFVQVRLRWVLVSCVLSLRQPVYGSANLQDLLA